MHLSPPFGIVRNINNEDIYNNKFRTQRMKLFMSVVDDIIQEKKFCNIVDVGGRPEFWLNLEKFWIDKSIYITIIDLSPAAVSHPKIVSLHGSACNLCEIEDKSFDIAHSNSVLEHVGDWAHKKMMAKEIARISDHHFIQTPNYWFPIEPHFRTLGIHWLPRPWQRKLVQNYDFAFYKRAENYDDADRILNDASLLDYDEMRELFPQSKILREKFFGMTKSLVAIG